jgi:transcription termination/antitermination protein NusG
MATKRTRSAAATLVPEEIPSESPADEVVSATSADGAATEPAEETDELSPAGEGHQWYVIHTYSGYENKVKANLEHRIDTMDAKGLILQVVIPTEDEIEIREGQRRTVSKKIFPGYVLVQMIELKEGDEASNKAWYVVRNTPGVTGFVGSGARPVPLDDNEVKQILRQMRVEEPRVKVGFQVGQSVRIIDGPFVDFAGQVNDINLEKGKVKVLVSFFGRETPVELDFLEVERL